jgi:hypothetical protein
MLPDEMEAEKNRKIILSLTDKINLMEKNVKELQSELNAAYKRIKELKENECSCGLLDDVHATEDY